MTSAGVDDEASDVRTGKENPADSSGASQGVEVRASAAPAFELYDLRVEVVGPEDRTIYCGAQLGDYFELQGEMLRFPPGQGFSLYSLAALLPLLPAKQRLTDPNDWMSTDAEVACPDPHCPTRFRITRTGRRRFVRGDVTATALDTDAAASDVTATAPASKGAS